METVMEILKEVDTKVIHVKKTSCTDDLHEFLSKEYPDYEDYENIRNGEDPVHGTVFVVRLHKTKK
jgi:hypothetical protein